MKPQYKIALHLFVLMLLLPSTIAYSQNSTIKPTDNLVTDGIPPISNETVEQVRRYTEYRGASFLDWHPTKREMLIGTRFANSNQVHLVKHPGGARTQLTFYAEPIGNATFDPNDGNYFVFTKDTGGNEFSQLFRYDVHDGNVTLLTDGGRSQNGNMHWSHAKNRLAYSSTRRNGADRDIWICSPITGKADEKLLVENQGGGWAPLDWSNDDGELLVAEMISINKSNLYTVAVATGKKTLLTPGEELVSYQGGKYSKDGKGIYLTCDQDSEFQRLCYMDLETRKVTPLVSNIEWNVEGFELSGDDKKIAYVVNEGGASKVYLYDIVSKVSKPLTGLPEGVYVLGSWRPDKLEIALTVNSARSPSDVYSVQVETGEIFRWTESELGGLIADKLSDPKLVRWKSFDDLEISGFYFAPPKKFTGKRPVIIQIHGGPEGQSRPVFQGRNNYFLNELGVAIILPNVRGSDGYGKTYVKLDNGLKRLDSVRDIGSLLDWIAMQPDLDADRVMVTGGSYGGYMTLACAVEYSDRISCSLDVVGISHFGTFLKNTESYRRDLRRVEYGDERNPEIAAFFENTAPLNNAQKISKPLFVVQGGNDPRVPLSEAEQIVAKVKANGSPIWYLMANDEGHGFRKKSNADFQFYATVEFVRKYLLR